MSETSYFPMYIQIIGEGLRRIKKGGLKKFSLVKEFCQTLEGYLNSEVYGRIQPANYLLLFVLMLGSRNTKIINSSIQTIQKLLSHNFVNSAEDFSSCRKFIKDQYKQFMLLNRQEYLKKSFKEIYILSLIYLPDKDDYLYLVIARNLSLIWRIGQSDLSEELIQKIYNFLIQAIIANKSEQYQKTLRSAFLEIIRHSFQSYRQSQQSKLLQEDDQMSIKKVCHTYGKVLFDQVAIKVTLNDSDYQVIPDDPVNATILSVDCVNEKNQVNGKFGWCILCRKPANFYCRNLKVPVCSYHCKTKYYKDTTDFDRLLCQQMKAVQIFKKHTHQLTSLFAQDLICTDIRRRVVFSQIFILICSQLKKFQTNTKNLSIATQLRNIFKQAVYNVMVESSAFVSCYHCIKKMLGFRIFVDEGELLLETLASKVTYYLTNSQNRQDVLKYIKQFVNTELIYEYFMSLDCEPDKKDSVKILIEAVCQFYLGIQVPENVLIIDQPMNNKLAYEIALSFSRNIVKMQKMIDNELNLQIRQKKFAKIKLRSVIQNFNESQKPIKIVKKYIKEGYFKKDAKTIAQFVHKNNKRLSHINIGILIGDHDEFACEIRDYYINMIPFYNLSIDDGLRTMLQYFTIPGQSQVVQRIIISFSKAYFDANTHRNQFRHEDDVYSFSYLLMMLQTNLHNPQVQAHDKMTIKQYSNLAKGMNSKEDFPEPFLEEVYNSVQRTQLGFHGKVKQMQILAAYKQNPKKGYDVYMRELEKQSKKKIVDLKPDNDSVLYHKKTYSLDLMVLETGKKLVDVFMHQVSETQQKQQLKKHFKQIDSLLNFSTKFKIADIVEHALKSLWDEISKTTTFKKFTLIETFLDWAQNYSEFIYSQWGLVMMMFSKFNRKKLIKKQNISQRDSIPKSSLSVVNDQCFVYESFVDGIISKSKQFTQKNLYAMLQGMVKVSQSEVSQNCHPYCLEKIGQVIEYNGSRLGELFPQIWQIIKDYYIQLGKNRIEKVALFGADFLKQLITKFIKKKDLLPYQREYLKPLEDIFNSSQVFGVKQYIIGSIGYFINNHFNALKVGWRVLLSILNNCFQQDEDPIIKQKAYIVIRKIFQSNFSIIDLDENYVDIVQILGRLSREKDQTYPRGCLESVKSIIQYYHKKKNIDPQNPDAQDNKNLDIHFLQTVWLPLLSTIYGICGDTRKEVQKLAVECLFDILTKYGRLFKYQFWKMVLQGVLRPTFEEIIYTSQAKTLKKMQLQTWLKNSFELLFKSITDLIAQYYQDFRIFLYDVLKIYENCVLNFTSKILIQLSFNALLELLSRVGNKFQTPQWQQFFKFMDSILKKSLPIQLNSLQAWRNIRKSDGQYEGKCLCLLLQMNALLQISQKYGINFTQGIYLDFVDLTNRAYTFTHQFNKNIALRQALWKEGFFEDLKSLPGLIKQQHESLKCLTYGKFKIRIHSEQYIKEFVEHSISIMDSYKLLIITSPIKNPNFHYTEQQRQSQNLEVLMLNMIFPQLRQISFQTIRNIGYREPLFKSVLSISNQKSYCSKCKFCQYCEQNNMNQKLFATKIKQLLLDLFQN